MSAKSELFAPVNSPPKKYTLVVPTLVIVTCVETCCPFVTVPKLTEAGVNLMPVPVPETATVCGLVTSLSLTLIVPEAFPTFVGLNTALMMHVPALAITSPLVQVVPLAAENGPVIEIAGVLKVNEVPVVLVSVILVAPLVAPTAVVANWMVVGLRVTLLVPVPVKPTS